MEETKQNEEWRDAEVRFVGVILGAFLTTTDASEEALLLETYFSACERRHIHPLEMATDAIGISGYTGTVFHEEERKLERIRMRAEAPVAFARGVRDAAVAALAASENARPFMGKRSSADYDR